MTATVIPVGKYGRAANKLVVSALTPAVGNTVDGMSLNNDGRTVVDVKNTNGTTTTHDVGFVTSQTLEGATVTVSETIPAGATWGFGPFDPNVYGTSMHITASHAELTFVARRVPLS
jgi:hypothetical protein